PRSGIGLSKPMPMLWKSVSVNSGGRWQSVQLALSELLKTSKPLTTSSFTADLSPAWYLSHGESCDRIVRRNVARACAIFPAVAGPLPVFESRVSKNSFLPSSTLSAVMGLSGGIAISPSGPTSGVGVGGAAG